MADIADSAADEIEATRQAQLDAATRPVPKLIPMGVCHYCEEAVDGRRLFCGGQCASDHQKELEQLKQLGREPD